MKWGRLRAKISQSGVGGLSEQMQFQPDIPSEGAVSLPPDPRMVDALAGNHRLETAVADLVDNSIDAGATRVLVRLVVVDHVVRTLYVIDNGRGMTSDQLDLAMTVGGNRTYGSNDLGHFGVGLKAASFSQADSLTVISRSSQQAAVGRRWLRAGGNHSFECDIIPTAFCEKELGRAWSFVQPETGTVVRWDLIRTAPTEPDGRVAGRFITDATLRISQHLGLVFHRFLAREELEIGIDSEETTSEALQPLSMAVGLLTRVVPIDPFDYPRSGASGYPLVLETRLEGRTLPVTCHIWPSRSQLPQFRLARGAIEDTSGFYFYRRDRLLQTGGWHGIEVKRKELQLARVAVEMNEELVRTQVLRLNPEKSKVDTDSRFGEAISRAESADGRTFRDYIEASIGVLKASNQRSRSRSPVMPLGRGVPARVRDEVKENLPELPGCQEVQIRWRKFTDDGFFEIDREDSTIWLNNQYRAAIAGEGRASLNDAAVVKTLLFLLVENLFHGSHWGPKDKDNLDLWRALLTVAAREDAS